MTSRQAIGSIIGVVAFVSIIGLLFVGQSYLSKHDSAAVAAKNAPVEPPETKLVSASNIPSPASVNSTTPLPQDTQLSHQQQLDDALDKANAAIQASPQKAEAYVVRSSIYAEKKAWDLAEKDAQTAIQLDGANAQKKFNLSEIKFMQKKYDEARPGFIALQKDPDIGDLASYKVFLCDLFAGHEDVAAKELAAFDSPDPKASYYFGNAAWSLYHQKVDDARSWLSSAMHIYAPNKCRFYLFSLAQLGYLPLPAPEQK